MSDDLERLLSGHEPDVVLLARAYHLERPELRQPVTEAVRRRGMRPA